MEEQQRPSREFLTPIGLPGGAEVEVLRVFIGIRFLFGLLSLLVQPETTVGYHSSRISSILTLAETGSLLVYLSIPWLRRRLGRVYLPLAIGMATLGPLIESVFFLQSVQAFVLSQPSPLEMGPNIFPMIMLTAVQFQLSIFLLVPLILVSWRYSFRVTVLYVFVTSLIDNLLPMLTGGSLYATGLRLPLDNLLRAIIFIFLGYIIHRLVKDMKQRTSELAEANRRLSNYTVALEQLAVSRERNRLAREFHDTVAHTLSAVAVQLEATDALKKSDPERADALLAQSLQMTRSGLSETRRAIQALRAAPLEDLGLRNALENLARSAAERNSWALSMELPADLPNLTPDVEHSLYRITEEALRNIGQHARARAVNLSLSLHDGRLRLSVQDDGTGFDPANPEAAGRFGLQGMRERAGEIGAALEITSTPGAGTRLTLEMPL